MLNLLVLQLLDVLTPPEADLDGGPRPPDPPK